MAVAAVGSELACCPFFVFLCLSLPGEVPTLIAKRHHCRFATVGSKSGSEGGF